MHRTLLAFLVAPIWAVVAKFVLMALGTATLSMAFSGSLTMGLLIYLSTAVIGFPAFGLIRAWRLNSLWAILPLGLLITIGPYAIGVYASLRQLGRQAYSQMYVDHIHRILFFDAGVDVLLVGALIGLTLWLVARPNLHAHRRRDEATDATVFD